MNVLTHISLNFQQPNYLTVYAAQNDRLSRYINAQLLDGSAPWTLPTGGLMTIRYRKPDGTSGFYDTLEDGSPAYNVETDGSITFGLAEQALTVPGAVPVELNFYNAAGSKLSTLTFIVAVKPSAYSDEDIASSDYYNILTAKMQQLAELSDQAEGDYQDYLSALSAFVGAPRTAPTAADMLDTNLVYVYTGSETGYTYGDWYYYNGREWVSGGVYNSAAISLDATLTNANKPAQAKAAGDLVLVQDTQPAATVNKLWFPLTEPTDEQVPTWDEFSDLKSLINKAAMVKDSDSTADLDVTDNSGNAILRLANGNVETKNFRGYDFLTFASPNATYNGSALTLTVDHAFREGDRIVLHMERGAMPWDYGAYVSYYEGNRPIKVNWRGDCAWLEYTVTQDGATISAVYAANAVGMTSGTVRLEVSLLGNVPIKPTVVTVKQDGSGDYTTLRGALDAIGTTANDVLNPYRIEIYPGTYDVMDDYTDDEIAAAAYDQTHFVGPKLLNGMHLIGIGNPGEVVINGDLSTSKWSSSIRGVVSTLNMQGSCGMENLTVIARHLRYCVHDDFHTPIGKKPYQIVKDCVFRGYDISYNPGTTFGAGTSDSGCDYDFINCDFGENGGVHTLSSTKARSYIRCVNCKGHGFRIGDNETSDPVDGYSIYEFDNCDLLWINFSMAGSVPHAKVRGYGGTTPLYQFPASVLYDTSEVVAMRNGGFSESVSVGKAVEWFSNSEHGPRFQPATSASRVIGICVYKDADDTYIQTKGFIRADRTSLTGYAIGDFIGLSGGNLAIVQSASDAFGKIAYIDNSGIGYIKLGVY